MANPLSKYGISDDEFMAAIRESAEISNEINRFMKDEVIPYGRSVSPVDTGNYAASWKITKKARHGVGKVGPTAWYSHLVEFGSGEPGPTKAHAPVQKTAEHFGGNLDTGIEMERDDGPAE